jgi:hypothetical protein
MATIVLCSKPIKYQQTLHAKYGEYSDMTLEAVYERNGRYIAIALIDEKLPE